MQVTSGETSDWSATQWDLAAPESYVLLKGIDDGDSEPFKLAVKELVTRRVLRLIEVEETGVFNRVRRTSVLARGAESRQPAERSLAAVWQLFTRTPVANFHDGTIGISVSDFSRAAGRRYRPVGRYTTEEVLPALVHRGYYALEERRFLGIFGSKRFVLTPAGLAARADLEQRMNAGRTQFAGWVRDDPNQALLYTGFAGSSLLLMPFLFSDVTELHRSQSSDESASGVVPVPMGSVGPESSLDFTGLDLAAIDELGTAFATFDAGFDGAAWGGDTGGWSGGDGGGGDGCGDGGGGGGGGD